MTVRETSDSEGDIATALAIEAVDETSFKIDLEKYGNAVITFRVLR